MKSCDCLERTSSGDDFIAVTYGKGVVRIVNDFFSTNIGDFSTTGLLCR